MPVYTPASITATPAKSARPWANRLANWRPRSSCGASDAVNGVKQSGPNVSTRDIEQRRFYDSNKINWISVEGVFGKAARTSFFISNCRQRVFNLHFVAQLFADCRLQTV